MALDNKIDFKNITNEHQFDEIEEVVRALPIDIKWDLLRVLLLFKTNKVEEKPEIDYRQRNNYNKSISHERAKNNVKICGIAGGKTEEYLTLRESLRKELFEEINMIWAPNKENRLNDTPREYYRIMTDNMYRPFISTKIIEKNYKKILQITDYKIIYLTNPPLEIDTSKDPEKAHDGGGYVDLLKRDWNSLEEVHSQIYQNLCAYEDDIEAIKRLIDTGKKYFLPIFEHKWEINEQLLKTILNSWQKFSK